MAGRGKPCGASHISAAKVCRVSLGPEVNRALAAATGEIGAASLKEAVRKYKGGAGVARLREIRREIRDEMGGNIVKGPRADELKRRLQEEGLLPTGKPKSMDAGALFQKQLEPKKEAKWRDKSVPPELKAQLAALKGQVKTPTAKPDSKYGKDNDDQLRDRLSAARILGKDEIADRIEAELKRRGAETHKPREKSEELPKGLDTWGKVDMRRIDAAVESNLTERAGKENYDWENSLKKDAKVLGQGAYGTAILGGNGDVVKRGEIGTNEISLIGKAGKLGVGPKVISAELDGPADYTPNASKGRIAMTLVEGEPIGYRTGKEVSNAYWQARATLHRGGIAHNDMHIENVLVGSDGKGRFVDMGMAQDNPKAALAEAMGVFSVPLNNTARTRRPGGPTGDGDWQARRYENIGGKGLTALEKSGKDLDREKLERDHPNAFRVYDNKKNAIKAMRRMGLTDQEITDIMFHGIRSTDSSFEKGAMGKLTNDQAKEIIEVLYDGIN
jgi:hypothetical protein